MAIDYNLDFATEFEAIEALNILVEKLSFEWWEQSHLIGTGLIIGATRCRGFSQSFFEKAYGFRPAIYVWFRLDKFADRDEGYRNMMRSTSLLLSHIPGDAVLVYNGEITVLQRIDGELILDSKWNDSPPAEIALPYKMQPLASPLL